MTAPAFVTVGLVDEHGEHHAMSITSDAVPIAQQQGWHVLAPTLTTKPDATGYSGPEDDDDVPVLW